MCQPTQLAAVMIEPRGLEIVSEFNSLIRPYEDEEAEKFGLGLIEEKALEITGLSRDELAKAPSPKIVWEMFCSWVKNYNPKGNKWSAPIMCGYNSEKYDRVIINRLAGGHHAHTYHESDIAELIKKCKSKDADLDDIRSFAKSVEKKNEPYGFGPYDKKSRSCSLFHPRDFIDALNFSFLFVYENDPSVNSISFDNMRDYFGISREGAHNAENDVKMGAMVMCRFIKYFRKHAKGAKFKNAFRTHDSAVG